MAIEKIMNKTVITVEMDDTLKLIKEIFDNSGVHHVLVVDAERLFGIISDRDFLRAISPNIGTAAETSKDAKTLNKRAHQIMTRRPVTLVPYAEIHDAIHLFNQYSISCIPVVDNENRPIGIISWRDIFKALESHRRNAPAQAD